MKVKTSDIAAASHNAKTLIKRRRAELLKEHQEEVAELHKSWWGRWFTEENHWDDEYNWYGHKDFELAKQLASAVTVAEKVSDITEITTAEADFVNRWLPR